VAGLRALVTAIRAEHETVPRILALGGVDADNAGSWVEAGVDGVAVMGAAMRADDPVATTRAIVGSVAAATVTTVTTLTTLGFRSAAGKVVP
jgi:thiamine monophosphate synthase